MNLKHSFDRRWMIAAAALVLVLSGCRISGQTLRGTEILDLRLPVRTAQQDGIPLTSDHIASRSFVPVTVHTDINSMIVPDPLWTELEKFRLSWCQQPANFVSVTPNDADYRIILKCDRAEDPIYYVHPTDLPPPLRTLIGLVPSTSDRLLPQ
jgi:hypothetical protein